VWKLKSVLPVVRSIKLAQSAKNLEAVKDGTAENIDFIEEKKIQFLRTIPIFLLHKA